MVDVRSLFKQMPRNRKLTVEFKTDRALMTGTPQRSVEGSLQVERFLTNDCKLFIFITFLTFFYFFLNAFYIYGIGSILIDPQNLKKC